MVAFSPTWTSTHLGEDSVARADEGEVVEVFGAVEVGEELLHGHANVEDLAVVVLVSVVPVDLPRRTRT